MRAVGWPGFVVRANLVRQLLPRICHHSAYCLEAVLTAAVRLMPGARQHLSGADILHVGASTELLEKRSCRAMLSSSGAIARAGSLLALRTSGTSQYQRYTVTPTPTAQFAYIGSLEYERHSSAFEIQSRSTLRCRIRQDGWFRSISRRQRAVRLLPRRDFASQHPTAAIRI